MRPPAAVLLDVGDTLLEEKRFDLEAGIGAVVDSVDVARLAAAFRADLADRHLVNDELLLARWLRERVPALADRTIPDIEDHIWRTVVHLAPQPGVRRMLDRLSADGVPLAAVSNAAFSGRVLLAELARHGLAESLRFVISSADLGSRKPEPLIFEAAVQRLGVAASATWFVGDTLNEDIVGALRAGLQPIWFSHDTAPVMAPRDIPVVSSWSAFLLLYNATLASSLG